MSDIYDNGEWCLCDTFGSVKSFRARVLSTDAAHKPITFVDRNGTTIRAVELVSFRRASPTRIYKAKAEIITGIIGGAWMPETKTVTFKAPAGLNDEELRQHAYAVVMKRWKTARFIGVER